VEKKRILYTLCLIGQIISNQNVSNLVGCSRARQRMWAKITRKTGKAQRKLGIMQENKKM
jgi:hypothetical protein